MAIEDRGTIQEQRALDGRIDAAAWGLLLMWVGVALLAHVGWGVGLVGVGVITLGAQAWRKHLGARVDWFSVILGLAFAVVGVWNLFGLRVDVVPLLFIAAGVGLLASAGRGGRAPGSRTRLDAPAQRRA